MFSSTKKIAIAAALMTAFTSGQFDAYGSGLINNNNNEDGSGQQVVVANAAAVAPAQSSSVVIMQPDLLPAITGRDMKNYMAGIMCDVVSPYRLASLSKAWHQFVLGRTLQAKAKEQIMAITFLPNTPSSKWLEKRDLQILNSGTFRYQPEGQTAIDVDLSTMAETNGVLVLPAALADLPLCVMRDPMTFVNPVGDNLRKTLVLLLTLSDLKRVAREISMDASFLQNVAQADLSQNAVCALIRYGGDNIADWGFMHTIISYSEMSGLSIWQLCAHENARGLRRAAAAACMLVGVGFADFIFKPKLDL